MTANLQTQATDTRIGKLEFDHGLPTENTVAALYDEMDFQRACQAYLWALPIVNIGEWQRADEVDFGNPFRALHAALDNSIFWPIA